MSHPERRYRRHELPPLSVWVRVGEETRRHQLLDLSIGGALIGTVELPTMGTEVELLLAHASWNEPVRIGACVVHHRFADDDPNRPVGMGVEFLEFAGDGELLLADVLALLERAPELGNPTMSERDPDTAVGRLASLRVEVQRAVALIMVLQREIDSYEEVDAQRRALTEHLLLEHRILKSDGPLISAETAARVEQTRAAIARLEEALAKPLDPSMVAAATAEVVTLHQREIQRARDVGERITELSARLSSEPEALELQIADQLLAVEQLRERIQRERHGWQVAINADLDCIAAIDDETEVLRQERAAAAEQHRLWRDGQSSELERLTHLAGGELSTGQDLARRRDAAQAESEAVQATVRSLTRRTLELAAEPAPLAAPAIAPVALAEPAPTTEAEIPADDVAAAEISASTPAESGPQVAPPVEAETPAEEPVEPTPEPAPTAEATAPAEEPGEPMPEPAPSAEATTPVEEPVEPIPEPAPSGEMETPASAGLDDGLEVDLTDAAEIAVEPPTPSAPPPPPADKPPSEAKARRTFALRLLRGGRLRLAPSFADAKPVEPAEVAISVLLQQTDIWEELLAASPPGLREKIAQRVFELYRDGSIEIVGGEEKSP